MGIVERETGKRSFDAVAAAYDRSRPGYPAQLFDDVAALSGLPERGRILEIGPGTGHATLPFAKLGYLIDGVELGPGLAERWRENLARFPNATIRVEQFEDANIPAGYYDLAIAASSFHWIDPEIGYAKVAKALKPGGSIALWWNRHETDQQYVAAAGPIYVRLAPGLIGNHVFAPVVGAATGPAAERAGEAGVLEPAVERRGDLSRAFDNRIADSGLFGQVVERRYEWTRAFDTGTFIELLDSYSHYRVLDAKVRTQLFGELGALIDEQFGGAVTRRMVTFLYVAQRGE